nr:DEAD/DEAH box helicase [Leucobacter sp. cx-169]
MFAFQEPGALSVFLGHRLLADPPGLGKTLQSIAVAAMQESERILIVCPPLLAVNWGREFEKCGYPGEIAVFKAGRKEPVIPDAGVVIVPDSLITSREELRQRIIDWEPQTMAVDEAHRMKSLSAKRTNAILDVSVHVPVHGRIAITGTPVMSTPAELVPLLEFTGHLGPIFGGADAFLQRFCTVTPFGKFNPRQSSLNELHLLLRQHVWVRREKARVLPFLPSRMHTGVELVVDAKPYREAHDAVLEKIMEWAKAFYEENGVLPGKEEQDEFCNQSLSMVSMLRVASALTKIPAAREMIAEHIANDPDNESPLVVWVHHHEITLALAEQMEELGVTYRILDGQESNTRRQAAVDDYQAGKIQVLIAGIIAAGVGITLTRGYEALFAETDWTPANVTQCMDRQHRIGQEKPVLARTLVALGTLDEHIQKLQLKKQQMLEHIHGDNQSNVAVLSGGELIGPRDIIRQLVDIVITKARKEL